MIGMLKYFNPANEEALELAKDMIRKSNDDKNYIQSRLEVLSGHPKLREKVVNGLKSYGIHPR